jgi:hypothetical protein
VANVNAGSGTRNRKADKIKNITALMMNELGSIRLPPGISRLLSFPLSDFSVSACQILIPNLECLGHGDALRS